MRLTLICVAGLGWTEWRDRDGDAWQLAPLLWPAELGTAAAAATLATGTLPEQHGVIGDDESWPLGTRATTQMSWRCQPFWASLAATGISTATVDWPASAPGSGWPGLNIDDRFAASTGYNAENWALPPDCVPDPLREQLRSLRVHAADLTGEHLLPIIPSLTTVDQERTHSIEIAARALARAATTQATALHLLAHQPPDFLAVHFSLPADLQRIGDERVRAEAGITFVRAAVARLRAAAPDRACVIAGHGTVDGAGLLAAAGITLDSDPAKATTVAAQLCATFHVDFLPEPVPEPKAGRDPAAHGYSHAPGPPAPWQASRLALLARILMSRAPATSRQLVGDALTIAPDNVNALRMQALCAAGTEDADTLNAVGERLRHIAPAAPWGPLALALAASLAGDNQRAATLLGPLEPGLDEAAWSIIGAAWLMAGDTRRAEAAFAKAPSRTDAALGTTRAFIVRRDFARAETLLQATIARNPVSQPAYNMLAELYTELGRRHESDAARARAERLAL